jgi:hypothetical protein
MDMNGVQMIIKFASPKGLKENILYFENEIFIAVEEKFFEKCPDYRNDNNHYIVYATKVLKFKAIKENNITDGSTIIVTSNDK